MKSIGIYVFIMTFLLMLHASAAFANEQDVLKTIETHINFNLRNGVYSVKDEKLGRVRSLRFIKINKPVGMIAGNYFACVDFKDIVTGELLDVDIEVARTSGGSKVVRSRIHKVNGVSRYSYQDTHNRSYSNPGVGYEQSLRENIGIETINRENKIIGY